MKENDKVENLFKEYLKNHMSSQYADEVRHREDMSHEEKVRFTKLKTEVQEYADEVRYREDMSHEEKVRYKELKAALYNHRREQEQLKIQYKEALEKGDPYR